MEQFWNTVVEIFTSVRLNIVYAVVILIVGLKLIKYIVKFIIESKGFCKIDPSAQSFIKSFLSLGLKTLLIISVISILGVPLSSVVAVLASVGLAIGLALQGALSNFAGGLIILGFKPYKVGDYIETNSQAGTVTDITILYTVLTTVDNKIITIPNGSMTNSSIINYTTNDTRRVDLTFSTSYNSDIDVVNKILLDIANEHSLVLQEPAPVARLSTHGDSALYYVLRAWCKTTDYWTVHFDITEKVKKEFDKQGIEIPFLQLDIHVHDKNVKL